MSEYSDEMSVTKLIGASAGYVGYEDGGLLVEQIRKHPHCVFFHVQDQVYLTLHYQHKVSQLHSDQTNFQLSYSLITSTYQVQSLLWSQHQMRLS